MVLQFMPEDNLITMHSNLLSLEKKFLNSTNQWLFEMFDGCPFKDTKYSVQDFSLDMSESDAFLTEAENVRRVYNSLRFLTDSEASDERLWAALCLGPFYEYTRYRWNIANKCTSGNIKQHFMFDGSSRRALTRNALSRLWWIGRLTYNDKDGYDLTDFICRHSDYIMHILERNTSNNPMIVQAFLRAVMAAENDGCNMNTDKVGELSKYLNLLGGTYILDCLSYQQIYDKIYRKAIEK